MLRTSRHASEDPPTVSLEEGLLRRPMVVEPSRVLRKSKRAAYARLLRRLVLSAPVLVWAMFAGQAPLLRQVELRVTATNVSCLTPRHLWGRGWRAISFENASLAAPRLVAGEGRVLSRETSSLCRGPQPPRSVVRFSTVTLDHRTPPWPWRRQLTLSGQRAACAQHMLDLFDGKLPCEEA